ncbi:hypothetical protein H8S75_23940 [Hungatella sp. L12]|uniref:Uncharacterized protein n=1 Tax=Hungatella hominis TaxID=2763050 RepID=A0ABR7HCU9_9FIRM|nr:hypothetical protein [Hungatella hominis]MBC5710993.1 hypothetical protein [Hungatella hominis]
MSDAVNFIISKVGKFNDWENREIFFAFREEMFSMYDALTKEEQEEVDESMVMEHMAMIYSCYVSN